MERQVGEVRRERLKKKKNHQMPCSLKQGELVVPKSQTKEVQRRHTKLPRDNVTSSNTTAPCKLQANYLGGY